MMKKSLMFLACLSIAGYAKSFTPVGSTQVDPQHNLQWQDNSAVVEKTYTIDEAIAYCEDLVLEGKDDWRVPNLTEILSLVQYSPSDYGYVLDAVGTTGTVARTFNNRLPTNDITVKLWTSTQYANSGDFYVLGTQWGNFLPRTKYDRWKTLDHSYVRCVRDYK